jgi:hypothetical protein
VLEGKIVGRLTWLRFLVVPGGAVVDGGGGVEAGEEAVLWQLEAILNEEGCVGVVQQVVVCDAAVFDGVSYEPAEEAMSAPARICKWRSPPRRYG